MPVPIAFDLLLVECWHRAVDAPVIGRVVKVGATPTARTRRAATCHAGRAALTATGRVTGRRGAA